VSADLKKLKATVVGVSLDDLASHRTFAKAHDLNFPLLADTDGALCKKFGVKTRGGFAQRVTFLIDRYGVVARVWPQVTPGPKHAAEVVAAVRALP